MLLKGNTLFYRNEKLPALPPQVDRVIISEEL